MAGVSWSATFAGAAASCALTLLLISFGVGMGFSVVSPWGRSGVSSTTFEIGTGLYFIVMAMISSAVGGYLAGRLRSKWVGIQVEEVGFRDTAHGFLAWAVASILGATFWRLRRVRYSRPQLPVPRRLPVSSNQNSTVDGYVDELLRSDNPSPQQANPSDIRTELVPTFLRG